MLVLTTQILRKIRQIKLRNKRKRKRRRRSHVDNNSTFSRKDYY